MENQKMLEDIILHEIDEIEEETHELKKLVNIPQNRIIKKILCANYGKMSRRLKL
jgi:transcription antitermination factor NusA-like protein